MSILLPTLAATTAAGVLSFACVSLVAMTARPHWVPRLVSYAVGALLGAVFLEILPHALSFGQPPEKILGVVLAGILLFFMMERMVLWRHDHGHAHEEIGQPLGPGTGHDHTGGRTGAMIVIGDSVHNFVDGLIISAAFTSDPHLGAITTLAIVAHEIPQETGDFLVLLHSGLTRGRALALNLLSSFAMVVGGVIGVLALHAIDFAVPELLALAAASMIYVAVADLIPGLHRRPGRSATAWQVGLILLGVGTIRVAHWLIGEP